MPVYRIQVMLIVLWVLSFVTTTHGQQGPPIHILKGKKGLVRSVRLLGPQIERDLLVARFSYDGRLVAAIEGNGLTKVWNTKTGKLVATFPKQQQPVSCLDFSRDSRFLAVAGADGKIRLWNVKGKTLQSVLTGHTDYVLDLEFDPNGKWLASSSSDATLRLWNLDSGKLKATLRGHTRPVSSINFSPNGKSIITSGSDDKICLWTIDALCSLRYTIDNPGSPQVQFSPDGKIIVGLGDSGKGFNLWETFTAKKITKNIGHYNYGRDIYFIKGNDSLALVGGLFSQVTVRFIEFWDIPTGKCLHILATKNQGSEPWIKFSSNGRQLTVLGNDYILRTWDLSKIIPGDTNEGEPEESQKVP